MHLPPLIEDLAVILALAAAVTFLFRLIKQPVVLGYIIAGVMCSPYTPLFFSVTDLPNVQLWAELGVIFFMFAMGLEFSFRKLAKVGGASSVSGVLELLIMLLVGYSVGLLLGWNQTGCLFLGAMVAVSSTTIILKTFEEMGLKKRRFAQSVLGLLVIEDLAAIIILVALSTIATRTSLDSSELLLAGGKFVFAVGAWFVVGMFLVPRFVRSVGKHGNDEMLTILSIGLCLSLVVVSVHLGYSPALGAFMMGSVLAETAEAERIEHLMRPLRDVFGAVFFISVGMLMDPAVLLDHFPAVIGVTAVILLAKPFAVASSSLLTGQTLQDSLRIGCSMAQVGEFSFIIATLGVQHKVIEGSLYPVIVAASLITTFTTPYFIDYSPTLAAWVEKTLSRRILKKLERYAAWLRRRQMSVGQTKFPSDLLFRWLLNGFVTLLIFVLVDQFLVPFLNKYGFEEESWIWGWIVVNKVGAVAYLCAMLCSAPFLWGMAQAFAKIPGVAEDLSSRSRTGEFFFALLSPLSRLVTVLLVGVLSLRFLPAWLALILSISVATFIFLLLKKHMETYYRWFELQFRSNFDDTKEKPKSKAELLRRLVPWDAHLVSMVVHPNSSLIAKPLIELRFREKHSLNIVAIHRGAVTIVAPKAHEILLPQDEVLLLGSDEAIEAVRSSIEKGVEIKGDQKDIGMYQLKQVEVTEFSSLNGKTIMESGIREEFGGIVVGIERLGRRVVNPKSDFCLRAKDLIWVVGDTVDLQRLSLSAKTGKASM